MRNQIKNGLLFGAVIILAIVGLYASWWVQEQNRVNNPQPEILVSDSTLSFSGQVIVISDWPVGTTLVLPSEVTIKVGNATAILRDINGTLVIEGAKLK